MQTRVFKNKAFARFSRRSGISDEDICQATRDAERGLIAADLGGGVFKQRVSRHGKGKSGGFRVLILFRIRELAIFVHGFAKSEKENISSDELTALKKLAAQMLSYREPQLRQAVQTGSLIEVNCNDED
jgi:hypothetical protein